MRAVFDLDDTICIHENRDYPNAKPVLPVIRKIRDMKKAGWEIVIYTARGQVSCKGDLKLIEQRNRSVVETWLKENDVPCDELLFGKPLGDLYVDDRAMTAEEFKGAKIELLHGGGSGSDIYRVGNVVKKYFNGADDVKLFKDWITDNNGVCKYPEVISYLYSSVFMQFIEGERLVDCCKWDDIKELLATIDRFKGKRKGEFSIMTHVANLLRNKSRDAEWNDIVDRTAGYLICNQDEIAKYASYCHGDLILSNVMKGKDGLYLIDPRYFRESSTYLFDLAKLRMSLMDYELRFGLATKSNREYLQRFDESVDPDVLPLVTGLMLMHICRLYRYKNDEQKQVVKDFAKEVISENEFLFW